MSTSIKELPAYESFTRAQAENFVEQTIRAQNFSSLSPFQKRSEGARTTYITLKNASDSALYQIYTFAVHGEKNSAISIGLLEKYLREVTEKRNVVDWTVVTTFALPEHDVQSIIDLGIKYSVAVKVWDGNYLRLN